MKTVILISGKMRSGKNQLAEYLQRDLEQKNINVGTDLYAKSVKDGCKEDFKKLTTCLKDINKEIKANIQSLFSSAEFRSPSTEFKLKSFEKSVDKLIINEENWYENKTEISRNLLQLYGTEIFRNRVDSDWWAKQVRNRCIESDKDVIIITDCRFPGEIEVFAEDVKNININLVIIRINRNINTSIDVANHDSETSLDNWNEWTYIVDNNGSLKNLQNSSKTIIKNLVEEYEYV